MEIGENKNDFETRNWIANKVISGKYNEPRILTLKLTKPEFFTNKNSLDLGREKEMLIVFKPED